MRDLVNVYVFDSNWNLQILISFIGMELDSVNRIRDVGEGLETAEIEMESKNIDDFSLNQLIECVELYYTSEVISEWVEIGCKNLYIKRFCSTCM